MKSLYKEMIVFVVQMILLIFAFFILSSYISGCEKEPVLAAIDNQEIINAFDSLLIK